MRNLINIVENAQEVKFQVKGRAVFMNGEEIGIIDGSRTRDKRGAITPHSGYYLRLKNGNILFRREGTDKFPWPKGVYSYREDLIRELPSNLDLILPALQAE